MTRIAWTVGRLIITIAVFAYVLRGFDTAAAGRALRAFSVAGLAMAALFLAADRLLMLWRWVLLVRAVVQPTPPDLARTFFVSSFLGSFLPAGVGGDAARALSVGAQTRQLGPVLSTVIVDRWLGLLAVGLSGTLGVLLSLAAVPVELREITLAAAVVLSVGTAAGLYADRLVALLLPAGGRLAAIASRFADSIAVYRQHPAAIWQVMALSLTVQVVRICLAWVIGSGLGITLPFRYYWVFMPLNILVILLPLSLGGVGLPQGAMVWTLGPLGVPPTEAFLLSLLFVLAGVVGNLPGAWFFVVHKTSRRVSSGGAVA